ncbi:MAG: RCC1 domain-containing protein, partial [Anaerolineae bacterium]
MNVNVKRRLGWILVSVAACLGVIRPPVTTATGVLASQPIQVLVVQHLLGGEKLLQVKGTSIADKTILLGAAAEGAYIEARDAAGRVIGVGKGSTLNLAWKPGNDETVRIKLSGTRAYAYPFIDGAEHSLILLANGRVMACGRNNYGQLGNGTTTSGATAVPVEVQGLNDVVGVAAGDYHSLALLADGRVMAWGRNNCGQLGDGTTEDKLTPVQVHGISDAVAVAAGGNHSLALLSDGRVMAWGNNEFGQLGDGTTEHRLTPVQAQGIANAVAIAAGWGHCLALLSDGSVMAWGFNGYGQLGTGTWGNRLTPVQVANITNVVAVSAGGYHSLALLANGRIMSWG